MRVGFVHGVMNTDNMSILGLTIDYGPYGWIDDFDPDWTPNTTDAQGRRYRFGWQPRIAYWNLTRLASALSALFAEVAPLEQGLQVFRDTFLASDADNNARKLGLAESREADGELMIALQRLLQAGEVDMTIFFRRLSDVNPDQPSLEPLAEAFYDPVKRAQVGPQLMQWLERYAARIADDTLDAGARRQRMNSANPRFVPRNYLAQQAIDLAHQGEMSRIAELLDVLRRPYDEQPGREEYAGRRPDWARDRAGCSMLSCSS